MHLSAKALFFGTIWVLNRAAAVCVQMFILIRLKAPRLMNIWTKYCSVLIKCHADESFGERTISVILFSLCRPFTAVVSRSKRVISSAKGTSERSEAVPALKRAEANELPPKNVVLALAFALELSFEEAKSFLDLAGYTLMCSDALETIAEYYLKKKVYDVHRINRALFSKEQRLLVG